VLVIKQLPRHAPALQAYLDDLDGPLRTVVHTLQKPYVRWARRQYAFRAREAVTGAEHTYYERSQVGLHGATHATWKLLGRGANQTGEAGAADYRDQRVNILQAYKPGWQWEHGLECSLCQRLPALPPAAHNSLSGRCRKLTLRFDSYLQRSEGQFPVRGTIAVWCSVTYLVPH
jgi:hypothetical protein